MVADDGVFAGVKHNRWDKKLGRFLMNGVLEQAKARGKECIMLQQVRDPGFILTHRTLDRPRIDFGSYETTTITRWPTMSRATPFTPAWSSCRWTPASVWRASSTSTSSPTHVRPFYQSTIVYHAINESLHHPFTHTHINNRVRVPAAGAGGPGGLRGHVPAALPGLLAQVRSSYMLACLLGLSV